MHSCISPPAVQLHLSKLDAVDPRPPVALAGIRQPRVLGGGSGTPAAAAVDGLAAQLQAAAVSDLPAAAAGAAAQQGVASAAPADGVADDSSTQAGGSSSDGSSASRFRYLVLDCDGVLVDSERASCEALRQAILQVRLPACTGVRQDMHQLQGA